MGGGDDNSLRSSGCYIPYERLYNSFLTSELLIDIWGQIILCCRELSHILYHVFSRIPDPKPMDARSTAPLSQLKQPKCL